MFNEKEDNKDIKQFEEALASLRPSADRLDPQWRSLLANKVVQKNKLQPLLSKDCNHQYACIYCGTPAPVVSNAQRWAWPTATAAITSVAAILLVMLFSGPERKNIVPLGQQQARLEQGQTSDYGLAMGNSARSTLVPGVDGAAYLKLRDKILRDGVDSWKTPVSPAVTTARPTETPLSYREQMNLLLKQEGFRGS